MTANAVKSTTNVQKNRNMPDANVSDLIHWAGSYFYEQQGEKQEFSDEGAKAIADALTSLGHPVSVDEVRDEFNRRL